MKLALFFLLITGPSWARPLVLLSYFNEFGRAPFNNSERVALALNDRLRDHPDLDLRLCRLETVFDKSFYQLEDCIRALPVEPAFVLSLGESNCNLKVELLGRNLDRTKGPDNEGNERNNTPIIQGGPKELGLTYPLPEMYCALSQKDRGAIEVSNNAGSFVCNNVAYQMANAVPDNFKFGFIHVPANNCGNLESKTEQALRALELMIPAALLSEARRLPVRKNELEILRAESKNDKCLSEFYKRAKGVDEKGFWIFSGIK